MAVVQIQLRHDTAATWASVNPTLLSGEVGVETDTGKFKIGNGSTVWNSLSYFSSYAAPTIGSTSIASGATVTTISGLTLSGATLTGSLTAGGGTGTNGQFLQSTGSGLQWSTVTTDPNPNIFMLMGS